MRWALALAHLRENAPPTPCPCSTRSSPGALAAKAREGFEAVDATHAPEFAELERCLAAHPR